MLLGGSRAHRLNFFSTIRSVSGQCLVKLIDHWIGYMVLMNGCHCVRTIFEEFSSDEKTEICHVRQPLFFLYLTSKIAKTHRLFCQSPLSVMDWSDSDRLVWQGHSLTGSEFSCSRRAILVEPHSIQDGIVGRVEGGRALRLISGARNTPDWGGTWQVAVAGTQSRWLEVITLKVPHNEMT